VADPEHYQISPAIEEAMDCEIFEIINKIKTRLSETVNERTAAFKSIEYQVRETYQGKYFTLLKFKEFPEARV
jgi:hypothetical protein